MTATRTPTLQLRVRGPLACFTRPEMKVERVSYDVMTPSAARGVLEAVLWKPGMRWVVERIHVGAEIDFISFRRNEVNSKAPSPSKALVENGGPPPALFVEDDRAQRSTVALRDVDYVIDAHIRLTDKAGPGDNLTKYVDMFERRVKKGQCFHRPYLGCRELAADFMPVDDGFTSIEKSRDLGTMLWDIDYGPKGNKPIFFRARLEDGVLHVPADPAATFSEAGA